MKAGFGSIRENLAKQHWFAHSYSVNRDRGHKVHGRVVLHNRAANNHPAGLLCVLHAVQFKMGKSRAIHPSLIEPFQ